MLAPDLPLRTERLLLRPLDPVGDVDDVHAYQSRPEVCRYIPYEPRTRDDVALRLDDSALRRSHLDLPGQALWLGVELVATGRLIGDLMVRWDSETHRSGEVGYVFNPDVHGHGYATEAVRGMLELAFGVLGWHRVFGRVDERNAASAAVLRRAGFRQEARLVENEWFKGEWTTELVFAILDTEWRGAPLL